MQNKDYRQYFLKFTHKKIQRTSTTIGLSALVLHTLVSRQLEQNLRQYILQSKKERHVESVENLQKRFILSANININQSATRNAFAAQSPLHNTLQIRICDFMYTTNSDLQGTCRGEYRNNVAMQIFMTSQHALMVHFIQTSLAQYFFPFDSKQRLVQKIVKNGVFVRF